MELKSIAGLPVGTAKLGCSHVMRRKTLATRCGRQPLAASASAKYDFDLFTIGAGSGGVRASRVSAQYGAKVGVCELPYSTKASDTQGGAGGTCVIRGCVPKKLLVFGSHFRADFADAAGFGWSGISNATHDWSKLMAAKNKEIQRLNGVYQNILKSNGVEFIEGRGKIVDPHTVDVDGTRYTAANILIATGARPVIPDDIPGKELAITSDDALDLPALPKRIVIVGAGYIGMEFAGIFSAFGSEVHLVCMMDRPLRGFDEEVRTFIAEQIKASGINWHGETACAKIEALPSGEKHVTLKSGEAIACDQVMFATGRRPNTRSLGLENAGVEVGPMGNVIVDKFSRTTCESVWAVGDVTNRKNLTPVATMEGMALAATLFRGQPTAPQYDNVATAVFTQPPIGTVGLTEEQAVASIGDVDVYTTSFRAMKHTVSGRNEKTFMKILVDAKTDKVVGVHMVGADAAEIMQGFGVAVKLGATKAQLDGTVGIHPTAAEELVTMRSVTRRFRTSVESPLK